MATSRRATYIVLVARLIVTTVICRFLFTNLKLIKMNIMNRMFRVSMWNNSVDEFAKVKTSDKSIWFINSRGKEERELLETKDYAWFDSRIDAFEWKKSKLEFEVKCKQDTLNYYQKKLDEFISSNGI